MCMAWQAQWLQDASAKKNALDGMKEGLNVAWIDIGKTLDEIEAANNGRTAVNKVIEGLLRNFPWSPGQRFLLEQLTDTCGRPRSQTLSESWSIACVGQRQTHCK